MFDSIFIFNIWSVVRHHVKVNIKYRNQDYDIAKSDCLVSGKLRLTILSQTDQYFWILQVRVISFLFLWQYSSYRSSRPEFCEKDVLRNFAKFTEKHLCQSLFFNKVTGLCPATLLKKRLWYRCFPLNFAKFLGTTFLTEHLWWLLQQLMLWVLKK